MLRDERMAHDVAIVQLDDADVFDAGEPRGGLAQPAARTRGKVDLRDVAR